MQTIPFGNAIELLVREFLELNQLSFICNNYRCRLGEIDLVMHDPCCDTLVFVEVRFRSSTTFGCATTSVDWKKQRKLRRAVMHYLQKNASAQQRARIDVVGVSDMDDGDLSLQTIQGISVHEYRKHRIVWTRNAIEGQ